MIEKDENWSRNAKNHLKVGKKQKNVEKMLKIGSKLTLNMKNSVKITQNSVNTQTKICLKCRKFNKNYEKMSKIRWKLTRNKKNVKSSQIDKTLRKNVEN